MEFRVLGPVEALLHGAPIELGRRRERALLGLLLLNVNQPVSTDRLIELLFDDGPSVRVAVSRLRRALAPLGDHVQLLGHPAGYVLRCDPGSVDAHRFADLVERARRAAEPTERAALLRDALALWRGPALAGLGSDRLDQTVRAHLEEGRLTALELRVEADLAAQRHPDLAELAELATEHPARERFTAAWMLALYRAGRQRDALDAYRRTAKQVRAEYGLDPGPRLRELHTGILRNDPDLAPATAVAAPPPVRPAQLPADAATFTGRTDELGDILASGHGHRQAVVITAIDGMAGVGKTALAVRAAHQLAPHYPDGQLFLDLHGYTEGTEPVDPGDALDRLLRSLGVPGEQIPALTDDRAALYRSVLTGRRLLVVLDNAATEAQVQPLLPGAAGCLTLITSRRSLTGLDWATPLSLDVLPLADAVSLFTRAAGPQRAAAEPPEMVEHVVELCGRLPLAIRIAAARLRHRPAWNLAHLAERLRDEEHVLSELEGGQRSVSTAIQLSHRDLSADQQRMLRLLSLHPGPDIDVYAAAALTDTTLREARRSLDDLLDAHLLQQHQPDRYRFHDLIRAFARQLCAQHDPEPEQRAAVTRLLDHYTRAAAAATALAYPHLANRQIRTSTPSAIPRLTGQREAATWLDTELANLLATGAYAADHGHSDYVIHLSATLHSHLIARASHSDAAALHTHAIYAARHVGHRQAEVTALNSLGSIQLWQGRYLTAAECHAQALDIAREIGESSGQLAALGGLGSVHLRHGQHGQAAECYEQSLEIARRIGDKGAQVRALYGLGDVHRLEHRNGPALDCYTEVAELARAIGYRAGEMSALTCIGHVHCAQGRYELATELLESALELAREIGNRIGESEAMIGIAQIRRARGEHGSAADQYLQALSCARDIGDRNLQFEALLGLGHSENARGLPEQALVHHHAALDLARELGQLGDQARAHNGLALGHRDLSQPDPARQHWQHALKILQDLGLAEIEETSTDDVHAQLAALKEA